MSIKIDKNALMKWLDDERLKITSSNTSGVPIYMAAKAREAEAYAKVLSYVDALTGEDDEH